MIITNSLGSNYTAGDVKRSLSLILHPSQAVGATEQLQSDLAKMFGVSTPHASLFPKGRQALRAALEQLGVGPGDDIIIQAFTCAVLPEAIAQTGATPVYVDVTRRSLHPALSSIQNRVTKKTKAVILQHTLGFVNPDNDAIVSWCSTRGITVIQDLAHAFGAPALKRIGSFSKGSDPGIPLRQCPIVLSFSQDKVIDGISGGALIITKETYRDASFHSNVSRYQSSIATASMLLYPWITKIIRSTYNLSIGKGIHFFVKHSALLPSPLDASDAVTGLPDPLASLALTQLKKLPEILAHRRHIAKIYDQLLKTDLKAVSHDDILHGSNLRYPIWVNNRDELEEQLKRQGFYLLDHWYDAPVSPSWHTASASYQTDSCPHAEELSRHIFNLPTHVNIDEKQAKQLVLFISQYAK